MLHFLFLTSQYQDALILGRTVKRHMLDALGVREEDAVISERSGEDVAKGERSGKAIFEAGRSCNESAAVLGRCGKETIPETEKGKPEAGHLQGKFAVGQSYESPDAGCGEKSRGKFEAGCSGQFEGEVVLTLDMPLVTLADIEGIVRRMRAKDIGFLRLGGEDSLSRIVLGGGESGYFANDEAFLKIVDTKSYSMVYNHLRRRIVDSLTARGVDIPFADSVVIDCTADIQAGASILPFSRIEGGAHICAGAKVSASHIVGGTIGKNAEVYASYIAEGLVGEGAKVEMSHVTSSKIGDGATVGPFARLRGADIRANCRIGDFVEVKASALGEGVKAAHLTYIGDADVGARTNIGCGTVFCNYDGKQKHHTDVGEGCFIGANTNLVAPISVGDGAFVAAGTTLTKDVPPSSFTVGRARQTTKIK